MSWFENWFDSPLYEQLYSDRNEDEAALLADLIEKKIHRLRYPHILDLGCGRGRHSITLALRGYRVTGIDLSIKAIKKAEYKARIKGAEADFIVGDMRDSLNMQFDAIVNLFTTFGYFIDDRENKKIVSNASSMLRTAGLLMIDFFNAREVVQKLVPEESGSFHDLDFHITRNIKDGMVFKKILFEGPSLKKPVQYIERVKLYELDWFLNAFNENHLELISVYGGYGGELFDAGSSPRLIMLSRKKGEPE
jgi:SAM-dependent methyltransferase